MNSLNSFMAKSLPTYENLFKAEHSDNQALVLFENYLCYRALLDVLSMRASRWEHLVKLLYHQVKDVLDEECMQWLHLVQLAVSVRDAILFPNQNNFSDVLKCIKVNGALFPSQTIHRELTDDLNQSVASYLLLVEKDKDKALEMCDLNEEMLEVVSGFPHISHLQRRILMNKKEPHSVLVSIRTQLRAVVMKLHSPALVGLFDKHENHDVQENEEYVANQLSSELTELSENEQEAFSQNVIDLQSTETKDSDYQLTEYTTSSTITTTTTATTATTTTTPTASDDDNVDNDGDGDELESKKSPSPNVTKKYFLRGTTNENDEEKLEEHLGASRSESDGLFPEKQPRDNGRSNDDPDYSGKVSTSSDDDVSEDEEYKPGKSRGVRHRWTPSEVKNLLDGIKKFGVGNWSNIYLNYTFLPCRDNVSLKDKWRNMIKNREVPEEYL